MAAVICLLGGSLVLHVFKPGYLSRLELLGHLPEGDLNYRDWQLAQTTSWWGKPLDPKNFWKGHVLWDDAKARSGAQRHGRLYPPMPYVDTNLAPYPNDEGIHEAESPDGPNISYAYSSTEAAFWAKFDKTHPRPPDQIEHEQKINVPDLSMINEAYLKTEAVSNNYPPEALTKDALFWAYVQMKRSEYKQEIDRGNKTNDLVIRILMGDLAVDPRLVTEPLSADQIKAANAWKIAYLQRLQKENVDPSYITAYVKAWNLDGSLLSPAPSGAKSL